MRRWLLWAACVAAALAVAAGLYLRTAAFQRRAEAMILGRLGATAQTFHLGLWPLHVSLGGVRMPGVEVAGVEAAVSWRSLLGGGVRLQSLEIEAPVVHAERGGAPLAAGLLGGGKGGGVDVAIRRLDVRHGQLYFADRSLPWEVHLSGVAVRAARAGGGFAGEAGFASNVPVPAAVSLRFLLSGDDVRLDHVQVAAAGATITASGWLRQIQRPQLAMAFHLAGPAQPLARALERYVELPEVPQAGDVTADGRMQWSEQGWSASANGHGAGLIVRSTGPWAASAELSASPEGFVIRNGEARGLGAHFTASGSSPAWRGLALDTRIEGLRLSLVRRFLPEVPEGIESVLSGAARIESRGPTVTTQLAMAAPADGALGASGTVALEWQPGRITVQHSSVRVADSTIEAAGRLAASDLDLNLVVHSPEVGGLRPLVVPLARGLLASPAPPDFGGAMELTARLTGRESAPTVAGKVALRHAHWGGESADALSVEGTVSADAANILSLSFQSGRQRITARGVVGLEDYRPAADSPLDGVASVEGLSLDRVRAWTGMKAEVQGLLSAHGTLHGTWGRPEGSGSLALAQILWRGQAARSVTADFTLRKGELSSTDLALALGRTRVRGSFTLGLNDHKFQAKLASAGVDLSEIAWLQSKRLAVRGSVRFEMSAQGTVERPEADLVFTTAGLAGGGESLGDVGGKMHLAGGTAGFQLADVLTNGSFHLAGTVATAAPYPVAATLDLREYDVDAWLRRFTPAELTGHSHISGTATLRGPLADPAQLAAEVRLDPVELSLSGLVIHNQGPVHLTADQRGLVLEPAHMVALDTDFTVEGSARPGAALRDPLALGGRMRGEINLALVHSLYNPLRSSGRVQVTATLGGTTAAPQVNGQVRIEGASLAEENSPIGFDGIDGLVRLDGRRLQVERLTAHTSGGTLSLAGFVAKLDRGYSFDLNASGQNLRLRYEGISATGNAQLRLSGQGASALLSGDAQLNRVGLDRNFDLAVFIASTQSAAGPPNPDSLLSRIRLNVHLVTGPQVEVATNIAHLQVQADIRLRGTLADPSVVGRASASEGQVRFAGNEYQVTKAQVQFVNPFRIEPLLDVGLRTTVQQYDVTLNLSGPADKLAITYRSDPPLSSSDVVALLATGAPTQATASLSAAGNYAPSEALLGEALNNLVAGRLQRLFGITQVQVNPNGGALGTTGSGGTVTIQQQVARNLKLTYTQNLASSAQDIVQVEWTISRALGLTLSRDQFGLYGLKFTFRHRKR